MIEWQRDPLGSHPDRTPVHAFGPPLIAFAPAGDTVLDPFTGSGNARRAATRLAQDDRSPLPAATPNGRGFGTKGCDPTHGRIGMSRRHAGG